MTGLLLSFPSPDGMAQASFPGIGAVEIPGMIFQEPSKGEHREAEHEESEHEEDGGAGDEEEAAGDEEEALVPFEPVRKRPAARGGTGGTRPKRQPKKDTHAGGAEGMQPNEQPEDDTHAGGGAGTQPTEQPEKDTQAWGGGDTVARVGVQPKSFALCNCG